MNSDDAHGERPLDEASLRVLVVSRTDRRGNSAPVLDSKVRSLAVRMSERLRGEWESEVEISPLYLRARALHFERTKRERLRAKR